MAKTGEEPEFDQRGKLRCEWLADEVFPGRLDMVKEGMADSKVRAGLGCESGRSCSAELSA